MWMQASVWRYLVICSCSKEWKWESLVVHEKKFQQRLSQKYTTKTVSFGPQRELWVTLNWQSKTNCSALNFSGFCARNRNQKCQEKRRFRTFPQKVADNRQDCHLKMAMLQTSRWWHWNLTLVPSYWEVGTKTLKHWNLNIYNLTSPLSKNALWMSPCRENFAGHFFIFMYDFTFYLWSAILLYFAWFVSFLCNGGRFLAEFLRNWTNMPCWSSTGSHSRKTSVYKWSTPCLEAFSHVLCKDTWQKDCVCWSQQVNILVTVRLILVMSGDQSL